MTLSLIELNVEVAESEDYKDLTLDDWKTKSDYRGITRRSQKDFDNLIPMYVKKIGNIREMLRGDWSTVLAPFNGDKLKTPLELGNELTEELQYFLDKETRLIDKFAACVKEVQMRKDGDVVRTGLHDQANYYVDYDNGTDGGGGTVHDGLAEPADPGGAVYTAVDGTTTPTDGTHCCLALGAFDNDADDNYNGDYLYNITRATGVIISDYDADDNDDASVLIHPNIAGQVAGDTFYILRATKNVHYMTTTLVRTAGDVMYLRANITWDQGTETVDITFDEDGNQDDYIKIIGCDAVTNDPWVDGDNTLPIIDFEDATYQCVMTGDHYWWLERLHFKQSNEPTGPMTITSCRYLYFKGCSFADTNHVNGEGMTVAASHDVTIDTCSFIDCQQSSIRCNYSELIIKGTTFTAGVDVSTDYGIYIGGTCLIWMFDSTFSGVFDTDDMTLQGSGRIYMRNVTLSASGISHGANMTGIYLSEDDDATFESQIQTHAMGIIARDIGTTRVGGADSSAKMTPNATCGPNSPLVLGEHLKGFARIWATKDVQINLSVYAAVGSAWDSALTAAECYAKFSYLNHAVNATRTEVDSTEQIANDTTWTALTSGNFTPLQTGWVYVWLYLEEYEDATEHIFVDIKPVVS